MISYKEYLRKRSYRNSIFFRDTPGPHSSGFNVDVLQKSDILDPRQNSVRAKMAPAMYTNPLFLKQMHECLCLWIVLFATCFSKVLWAPPLMCKNSLKTFSDATVKQIVIFEITQNIIYIYIYIYIIFWKLI